MSTLSTDLIKIKLVDLGYLKDYPYHLISDEEMCDAFISPNSDEGYFFDAYPLISTSGDIVAAYSDLIATIRYYINELKQSTSSDYTLPDWIQSYMLGEVVSVNSDYRDIHDLINPLNVDNIDDIFTVEAQEACYRSSKIWIGKLDKHTLVDTKGNPIVNSSTGNVLTSRPVTIFGEPHVLKYVRLVMVDPKMN